jgi:hypothetical protein
MGSSAGEPRLTGSTTRAHGGLLRLLPALQRHAHAHARAMCIVSIQAHTHTTDKRTHACANRSDANASRPRRCLAALPPARLTRA